MNPLVCPRCGTDASESRWCSGCGLNLEQQERLPTREEFEAREREQQWLSEHEAPESLAEGREEPTAKAQATGGRRRTKLLVVGGLLAAGLFVAVAVLLASGNENGTEGGPGSSGVDERAVADTVAETLQARFDSPSNTFGASIREVSCQSASDCTVQFQENESSAPLPFPFEVEPASDGCLRMRVNPADAGVSALPGEWIEGCIAADLGSGAFRPGPCRLSGIAGFRPGGCVVRSVESVDSGGPSNEGPSAAGSGPAYDTYASADGGWKADVPVGGGWSEGVETQINPGLHRTTFTGPGGAVLIVDSSPSERPKYSGDAIRTSVSHPIYGEVEKLVFRGNTSVTPCETTTCVDFLIPANGGGYGVLAGGPGNFAELEAIAETAMLRLVAYGG